MGEKTKFLLINLLKGLAWFALLLALYFVLKNYVNIDYERWLRPVFDRTWLIFTVYTFSEFVFGVLPPELFMMWALRFNSLTDYIFLVFVFAVISYIAGFAGYLFGAYLNSTIYYRYVRKRFLGKYHSHLQKYGVFMILVAAITPLPFSGISMLVGSFHYPMKNYLLWALSRFLRFAVYAILIWEANLV
ncbi:MAG: VTT domain-containing protein [Bacteroidales bacterium]